MSERYWTPQRIDEAFDNTAKKLGRTPKSHEFPTQAYHRILDGSYDPQIKTWKHYLRHKNSPPYSGLTREKIDNAVDQLMKELGRVPTYGEFEDRHTRALSDIKSGDYSPEIKSWSDYLEQRRIKPRRRIVNWAPQQIDAAFDGMKKELERNPTFDEFAARYSSAIKIIISRRYDPQVRTWRQYLKHRGLSSYLKRWLTENIDEAFDQLMKKLGRVPTYDELKESCGSGPYTAILKGRYSSQVRNWNQYLAHRGLLKITSAPSFREFVETHEDAQKAVRLFAYNEDMVDPLVGRILALWYPHLVSEEDAIEYLPSLGPWLGRFRKPRPSGDFGDVIAKIPMPVIDRDQILRDGFLKLGRDHYMSLMNAQDYPAAGDEQSFLDLIKEKAEGEPNETLRWLHSTLYDEFGRFFEIVRQSRRRRPVPEEVAIS